MYRCPSIIIGGPTATPTTQPAPRAPRGHSALASRVGTESHGVIEDTAVRVKCQELGPRAVGCSSLMIHRFASPRHMAHPRLVLETVWNLAKLAYWDFT